MKHIKTLYELRENVIKLFNDYSKIASKAKYRSFYGEEIKILTFKEMLQSLPITLARIKSRYYV